MKFEIKNAVTPLLIANIIFFALQFILGRIFTNSFILISSDIITRPWILISHMFLHSGPYHLLFNMYVLLIFGPMLEQRIGAKRFLTIYFLSGIVAGIISSLIYPLILGRPFVALGASGAVMGMLGVLIILMPDLKLLFFFIVPMQLRTAAILIALIDVFGIFYPTGIGNIAHLAGLASGLLYGLSLKKEKRKFVKKFSSKQHLDSDDVEDYLRSGRI